MYIETTLEDLNNFIKATFNEEVIPHLTLKVSIEVDRKTLSKTYPPNLPIEQRAIYDEVKDYIEEKGSKLDGIRLYRARTGSLLREAKDFVDKWFPGYPFTKAGRY